MKAELHGATVANSELQTPLVLINRLRRRATGHQCRLNILLDERDRTVLGRRATE